MRKTLALSLLLAAGLPAALTAATRLKELVSLQGVRDNQLIGYGLVVGLKGTGDRTQTQFSAQSVTNLLQQMGVAINPLLIQVKNTAAVMVTATLPPYAQPGMKIDVTVAAMGDSASLQGGILVMTGLRGPDGKIYAVAQGATVLGGYSAAASAGGAGAAQIVNHPTVGRIPDGAIVEVGAPTVKIAN